jgi:hypothetical protein
MSAKALFGGKPSKKKPSSKKTQERQRIEIPKNLRKDADTLIAGLRALDGLKKKVKIVEKRIKSHMLDWWCKEYALTGKRPEMAIFETEDKSIQFIQTRRMTPTADKLEALEAIGADISDYVETTGVKVNVDALKKHGLMDKLMSFMDDNCTEEQMSEIFEPVVSVKENILESLPHIVEGMDGERAKNMRSVMDVLTPTSQLKKPEVPEDTSDVDCFKLASEAKISAT